MSGLDRVRKCGFLLLHSFIPTIVFFYLAFSWCQIKTRDAPQKIRIHKEGRHYFGHLFIAKCKRGKPNGSAWKNIQPRPDQKSKPALYHQQSGRIKTGGQMNFSKPKIGLALRLDNGIYNCVLNQAAIFHTERSYFNIQMASPAEVKVLMKHSINNEMMNV